MARFNGPIPVYSRNDTTPTDAEGGYAGGDATAAAITTVGAQATAAMDSMENLSATATTVPPGAPAAATVTGPLGSKVVNFSIPRGEPGMGAAEGAILVSQAQAAQSSASTAASNAASAVTLAQQAQAAAYQIPDQAWADMAGNPATETRAALDTYTTPLGKTITGTGNAATDTAALSSLVTSATALGVPVVLRGDFQTNASITVPDGGVLRSDGATITQTGATRYPTFIAGDDAQLTGLRMVGIPSLWVNGSGVFAASAVKVTGVRVKITDCTMTGHAGTGVYIDTGCDADVNGCTITGPGPTYITSTEHNYSMGVYAADAATFSVTFCDISGYAQGILTSANRENLRIVGNRIHDIPGQHGMYITQATRGVVANNVVWNTGLQGMKVQLGTTTTPDAKNLSITGNVFQDCGSHGILLTNPSQPSTSRVRGVTITGNVIENAGEDGINLTYAADVIVNGNVINGPARHGILLDSSDGIDVSLNRLKDVQGNGVHVTNCTDWTIAYNRVRNPGQGDGVSSEFGVYVTNLAADGAIRGNKITDANSHMRYGIYLVSTADQPTISIDDNYVSGATDYGLRGASGSPVARSCTGNQFNGSLGATTAPPANMVSGGASFGTATLSGASMVVTHNLGDMPRNVLLTAYGNVNVWVTSRTTTTFTINQSGTGSVTVGWQAQLGGTVS